VWDPAIEKGKVWNYPSFKPWQEEKILGRIKEEADRVGVVLGEGVPLLFLKLLGDNLRATANELHKVVHLIGKDGTVTRELLLSVIAPDSHAEPHEVAEAATSKDVKTALRAVSVLFKSMGDGAAVPVTSALMKQVERLLIARQMADKGDAIDVIATRLEMHKFVLQKSLMPKTQRFTVRELRDQMKHLCRLETQVKGAARSKRTLVELAVISISA
jgi:DNA polymerase III delta subunit